MEMSSDILSIILSLSYSFADIGVISVVVSSGFSMVLVYLNLPFLPV